MAPKFCRVCRSISPSFWTQDVSKTSGLDPDNEPPSDCPRVKLQLHWCIEEMADRGWQLCQIFISPPVSLLRFLALMLNPEVARSTVVELSRVKPDTDSGGCDELTFRVGERASVMILLSQPPNSGAWHDYSSRYPIPPGGFISENIPQQRASSISCFRRFATMTSKLWPKELNKLCPDCEHLYPPTGCWPWDGDTIGKFVDTKGEVREPSVEELDASATSNGCHLCRALLECILPGSLKFNRYEYPAWFELNKEFRYSVSLYAAHHNDSQQKFRASPVFSGDCLEKANASPGRWIIKEVDPPAHSEEIEDAGLMDVDVVQPTSATTFDPLAFEQLRRWIEECTQTHELCKIATSGQNSIFGFQQTVRLVDVGLNDNSPIRLVEGFRVDQVRYNTLSHQWTADTPKTSLKKHNKAAYCQAIPTQACPKVYKDVVVVCRALGVRYVPWIDSLCIVQDDLEDWKVESSMMQDIYSHGYLNLANVLGKHADGLEVSRDPTATSPCILSRTLADGSRENWGCIEDGSWREQIQDAPLYTRGWCYQERFLSARTVQFGQQLYWECREQFASESVPSSKAFYDIKHPDLITTFDKANKESAGGTLSPNEIWDTVVKIYTTTQLTQQSDKLVALRGVFNRFWERFEAEAEAGKAETDQKGEQGQHQQNIDWCIAGLWKRDLIRHLLWRRETYHLDSIPNPERWPEGGEEEEQLFNARAAEVLNLYPSWSWAACPSYLGFGICFTSQPTDRVEDMVIIEQIVPRGTSTDYTSFDSSALILRGLLYDGITAIDLSQVFLDWATKSESSGTVKHHAQLIRRSAWWIYFDRPLTHPIDPKNVGVLMVRLVGLGEVRQTRWMHGLLVEKLPGTGEDGLPTYRRMGFFLLRSKRGLIPGVEWPERFETVEEAEGAVKEVRGRRGGFPLLRLV